MDIDKLKVQLCKLVTDSLDRHSYSASIFYCDKLLQLSTPNPSKEYSDNIYLYCDCLFRDKQYQRTSFLLQKYIEQPNSIVYKKHIYLAGRAKLELQNWENVLKILGDDDQQMLQYYNIVDNQQQQQQNDTNQSINISSMISLLRAKAFEGLDNLKKAKYWYIKSLKQDYKNHESFESLVNNHILNYTEELELISLLNFSAQDKWLEELYSTLLKKKDNKKRFINIDCGDQSINQSLINIILKDDKYYNNKTCLMVNLSSMYELGMKNELHYQCHQLIDSQIQPAIAWYGIACYYHLIQNIDMTQKAFTKSTTYDSKLGASWLGFGHYFANKGEHDQAMSAYRTASRLLTGLHLPLLCIGMELIGIHNFNLAEQYLQQALDICPYDPLIYNELGVIAYKAHDFKQAIQFFLKALDIANFNQQQSSNNNSNSNSNILFKSNNTSSSIIKSQFPTLFNAAYEPTLFNLAHCYRKCRQFNEALKYYQIAHTLSPGNSSIYSALGFTHHLQGNFDEAIDYYHQSLSIRDDNFTNTLLNKALSLSLLKFE
ncbi:TPR repeat-containing protein [Heterostelium album PN500]|uniref:TPR repeat-containing protein n=1 Tax=Heterostelium pallidum (strain ATCC 26659 / Pp 5 / PN500) TaxID=670386 RepID=D3AYL4_HETP5|nr:TPR repeat-containing protein [Heterostelium album PN500]EFA86041.1 TPR repeat-containing protein [Heterostelium album PN500]|eukprot:XP_020438147.1 TPR repeat-containing protein [Heterostelium album PN500]